MRPVFSVVIPAHNEEHYIAKTICAVGKAARRLPPKSVEVIVVANRCTDRTAEIAKKLGARVIENDADCIAGVRNAGAKAARGDILVTIDADSCMTPDSLTEIGEMLKSGDYIGGGTIPEFDRNSVGIMVSSLVVALHILPVMLREKAPLSGGMFWMYRETFEALGGFDESLVSLEDMDLAVRLKRYGGRCGKRFGILRHARIITSARKFDQFGDWYLLRNYKLTRALFTGKDRAAADAFYYNVR